MINERKEAQSEIEVVMLEELVPQDHLLKKIDKYINFSFIRDLTRDLYCHTNGRPAVDPVVLFKMLFIGYLYGIRSERQLVKDIEVNGTENLIKKLGNDTKLVTIFLKVNKEELKNRLINRGDNLSEADMQLRLGRLEYEESKIGLYDYVIKNDNLEKTVQIIMTIIENEKKLEETKIKN